MRAGAYREKLGNILSRYKYALIVAALGLVLLSLPVSREKKQKAQPAPAAPDAAEGVEEKLENLLSMIEGVGDARVMLTVLSGPEALYAEERSVSTDAGSGAGGARTQSEYSYVVLRGADGGESLVETKRVYARYKGALVVCRGADDPSVRLAVSEAVRAVTGLGADCITVAKME